MGGDFHAETVTIGCDVADHFSLLDVADLVSRIDAEPIHTVVDVSRSGKRGCTGVAVRSDQNRVHIALHVAPRASRTRSFSSSLRTKYFRKCPMNCIEKSLT